MGPVQRRPDMVSMVERAKNEADEPIIRGKRGDNVRREERRLH